MDNNAPHLGKPFIAGSINDTNVPLRSKQSMKASKQNKILHKTIGDIDQLKNDEGYRVYHELFNKIRFLIIILGLWAPRGTGCCHWFLRNVYPILIYCIILYPWTTFITQQAYWSIPVFLFITLHIAGWVSYYAARKYWKQDHFYQFITSTFIPFYDDINDFQQNYNISDTFGVNYDDVDGDEAMSPENNREQTIKTGFFERYKRDNQKRKAAAERKFHLNLLNKEDTSSFADIESSTNKLSMSLFYEGVQRLWWRFWILTAIITIPIICILLTEIIVPSLHSSIDTSHKGIHSEAFADIFVPFNTIIIFIRFFYVICEFVFMMFYFKFICECHRGDCLIHLHYFDTSDIINKYNYHELEYYKEMEIRLASIVWNWDRVVSVTQKTSIAFRYYIFITFMINFIAAVVAIINLSTHLEQFPQHFEMYIPALVSVIMSLYILYIGAEIAHMNTTVDKRTYFLLATTHFSHVEMTPNKKKKKKYIGMNGHNRKEQEERCEVKMNDDDDNLDEMMLIQVRQQNLYAQAQTVAKTSETLQIGIAVYGLVLHRNLFILFLSPFVAFTALCLNEWLPKGI